MADGRTAVELSDALMRIHARAKGIEPITGLHYLLCTPRDRGVRLWAGSRILAPAAIGTLPKWMRHMGNFDQPAAVDSAVTAVARAWVRALSANNFRPMLAVARRIAPETADVLSEHLTAGPPARRRTITPAEVRERLAARV